MGSKKQYVFLFERSMHSRDFTEQECVKNNLPLQIVAQIYPFWRQTAMVKMLQLPAGQRGVRASVFTYFAVLCFGSTFFCVILPSVSVTIIQLLRLINKI
ncbi:hypothetical protein C7N43_13550 [Sphingobacteriales bacterium UPWRP_1]|nr:hypothetical protein BVG80_11520 [Sphingobacteriales bacterium TSM_CSM]PSJ76473.1 hypothetical protein C7N43_13550 [Sphingobacteriales bacterium UPWRP_1]